MIKQIKYLSKSKIINLMMEIRDLVNSYPREKELQKDARNWQRLCSSMDTIEDVEEAINEYQRLPEFQGIGSGYIYFYGLFQAFYVQQDAVRSLSKALLNEDIDYKNDKKIPKKYPDIWEVRGVRDDIFGHPTDRAGDKRSHVISRITMTKGSFDVLDYYDDHNGFRKIIVSTMIKKQSKDIEKILRKIKNGLKSSKKLS